MAEWGSAPPTARQCIFVYEKAEGIYHKWPKGFVEAGKQRLAGATARAAHTDELKICAEGGNSTVFGQQNQLTLWIIAKSQFNGAEALTIA